MMTHSQGQPMCDDILVKHPTMQSEEAKLEVTKSPSDLHHPDGKAFEAIAGVRADVNKLTEKVATLEGLVRRGNEVDERELSILTELLMVQLLKLDSIEADGEARVQRGIEVRRVQSIVDRLDNLKASRLSGYGLATEAGAGGDRPAPRDSTRVAYDWERFE